MKFEEINPIIMLSTSWFWLIVASCVFAATCPLATKISSITGVITMVAKYVFAILLFFFAPAWWWGLIMLIIVQLVPMLMPKIDVEEFRRNGIALIYNAIGNILSPICVILAYLSFFVWK